MNELGPPRKVGVALSAAQFEQVQLRAAAMSKETLGLDRLGQASVLVAVTETDFFSA